MIIDISSYNGNVDFDKMLEAEDIERVIMRSVLKNGEPDSALSVNVSKLKQASRRTGKIVPIDFYKFTYATNFSEAYTEAFETLMILRQLCLLKVPERLYLDIEPVNGKVHTKGQVGQIIAAYASICKLFNVELGIYCNYSYLKNYIPEWASVFPVWIARWNDTLGDTEPFNCIYWQYTDHGKVTGINGNVDISRCLV